MRAFWQPGDVVVLKIRQDLFSVAIMSRVKHYLFYFLNFRKEDNFESSDELLSKEYFCTSELGVIKHLAIRRIRIKKQKFELDIPELWIRPRVGGPGRAFEGGDLTKCVSEKGPFPDDPVVCYDLDLAKDMEKIRKYELTNMMDYETIRNRLAACFDNGKMVDPLKAKIFNIDR